MRNFIANLKSELKRLFRPGRLIALLVIVIVVCFVVNGGVNDYKNLVDKGKEFQDIEALNCSKFKKYSDLAIKGIGIYFLPSQLAVISSSPGLLSDLNARIDTVIGLNISGNLKGPALFYSNSSLALDFNGIIRILLTFFAIFFIGYESLRDKEYLKSLSGTSSSVIVHLSIIVTRLIFIAFTIIIVYVTLLALLVINDVSLSQFDIAALAKLALSALLMMIFFFFLGALTGHFYASNWKCFLITFVVWAVFAFGFQGLFKAIIRGKAEKITSSYRIELEQFKIVSDFEKRAIEERGKFDRNSIEAGRKVIEGYWNDDYKKIEVLEETLKQEIASVIKTYKNISIFTPTSFYTMTGNAVSSRGYDNYLEFYSYLQVMKRKLLRFWFDRVYYKDPKVMVPFIKGDENLFKAKSRVPDNFTAGILINLGYIIILFFATLLLSIMSMSKTGKKETDKLGDVNIKMEKGNLYVWLVAGDHFKNLLFNLFSGKQEKLNKSGFTGKMLVNNVDIAAEKNKEKFLYICKKESLPGDIKVNDFITSYARMQGIAKGKILDSPEIKAIAGKRIDKLTDQEKFETQFSLLKMNRKQVYLIDNIASGLPLEFSVKLLERMEQMAKEGSLVIYLSSTEMSDINLEKSGLCFYDGITWIYKVKYAKDELKYRKQTESEKKSEK